MNKFIKYLICTALAAFSLCMTAVAAEIGELIGYSAETDIEAAINFYDMRSFNIDGNTVIIVEDLKRYGFDVVWSAEDRALYVKRSAGNRVISYHDQAKTPANRIGIRANTIRQTDIKVFINGREVESYNIDSLVTAINFEELGVFGELIYNNDSRRLDLFIDDGLDYRFGLPTAETAAEYYENTSIKVSSGFFFYHNGLNEIYPAYFWKNNTNKNITAFGATFTLHDALGATLLNELDAQVSFSMLNEYKNGIDKEDRKARMCYIHQTSDAPAVNPLVHYIALHEVRLFYDDGSEEVIFIGDNPRFRGYIAK